MDEKRKIAAQHLLDAAHDFWKACQEEGQYGAVQWLQATDGAILVFTRGEYREKIMANIETLPEIHKMHIFSEEINNTGDEELEEDG